MRSVNEMNRRTINDRHEPLGCVQSRTASVARYGAVLVCNLLLSSCAINNVEKYPPDWPARLISVNSCSDVSGIYADSKPYGPTSPPAGAELFLFLDHVKSSTLRLYDKAVKSRVLHVYFDSSRTLHMDYLINGTPAASLTRARSVYRCGKHGLVIPMYRRSGAQIFDMLPNYGRTSISLVMFRVGDYLYIEWDSHAEAWFYHVIPETSHNENWMRFLVVRPRRLPSP